MIRDTATLLMVVGLLGASCATRDSIDDQQQEESARPRIPASEHPIANGEYDLLLRKLDEPSLFALSRDSEVETYRLLWLRSFEPCMSFRINLAPSNHPPATLIVKKLETDYENGELKYGTLIRNEEISLSEAQVSNVRRRLVGAQFWTLPTADPRSGGLDGANWILEGVKSGKYNVTERWSPLPPYFGWWIEGQDPDTGEVKMQRMNPPMQVQTRHSDEVGLDILSFYLILLGTSGTEEIY